MKSLFVARRILWAILCSCLAFNVNLVVFRPALASFAPVSTINVFYDTTLRHNIPDLKVSRGDSVYNAPFLQTYTNTGGLTRWGHPTSEVLEESEGSFVQYYQRGVMEWHSSPTCNPAGSFCMERKLTWDCFGGGGCGSVDLGVEPGRFNPNGGDVLGPWGHKVSDFSTDGQCTGTIVDGQCHGFRWFFNKLGGVDAFGFPKTDARFERYDLGPPAAGTLYINALAQAGQDGPRIRQYFQAAVMEFHPDDRSDPIKLRLLGDDLRDKLYPGGAWKAFRSFRDAAPQSSGVATEIERVLPGPRAVGGVIGYLNHITEVCSAAFWQSPAQPFCGIPSPSQPSQPAQDMTFVPATLGMPLLTGDLLRTRVGSPDFDIHAVIEMIKSNLVFGFAVPATNAQLELGPAGVGADGVLVLQGDVAILTTTDPNTEFGTPDADIHETGTLFLVSVSGSPGVTMTTVKVVEGQLNVRPRGPASASPMTVNANEQISVASGRVTGKRPAQFTNSDIARIRYLQQSLKPLLGSKAPVPVPPPAAPCPALQPGLRASASASSNDVTLTWNSTGGCGPISGTLSARYEQDSTPYKTYAVASGAGQLTDSPPPRCEGVSTIVYTLTLKDSTGAIVTSGATARVTWIC